MVHVPYTNVLAHASSGVLISWVQRSNLNAYIAAVNLMQSHIENYFFNISGYSKLERRFSDSNLQQKTFMCESTAVNFMYV